MRVITKRSGACVWASLLAAILAGLALAASTAEAQIIAGFECGVTGQSPSCDGWSTPSGVASIVSPGLVTCAGLPSEGLNFCQLPAAGGPAFPPYLGVGGPTNYPYSSGVAQLTRTFIANQLTMEIDYNWSAIPGSTSFFEILLVHASSDAVLGFFARGDALMTPLPGPPCTAVLGGQPTASTGKMTGTVTIPSAFQGLQMKVVCITSENLNPFVPPASFLNVDNLRYPQTPPTYPGNGADCDVEVFVNGQLSNTLGLAGVHDINPSDNFMLRLHSPSGTLSNQLLALVTTIYPTGSLLLPVPLLGAGNPADVWIDPMNAVVLLDSLSGISSIFFPQLVPGGYLYGPFATPAGISGNSAMVQMFVNAPGFNPVNLGASNAEELRFL
jgi:hypothetical protein